MKSRQFKVLGKNIISTYDHDIMSLKYVSCNKSHMRLNMIRVTDQHHRLINGTYSAKVMSNVLKKNKDLSDSFIFLNDSKEVVGTLSVIYRGGNDIEYKIRNIDAFIISVLVLPQYRGLGFVADMIFMMMKYLHDKGVDEVYLAVSTNNASAIRAYNKIGFATVKHTSFIRVFKINIPYYVL